MNNKRQYSIREVADKIRDVGIEDLVMRAIDAHDVEDLHLRDLLLDCKAVIDECEGYLDRVLGEGWKWELEEHEDEDDQ